MSFFYDGKVSVCIVNLARQRAFAKATTLEGDIFKKTATCRLDLKKVYVPRLQFRSLDIEIFRPLYYYQRSLLMLILSYQYLTLLYDYHVLSFSYLENVYYKIVNNLLFLKRQRLAKTRTGLHEAYGKSKALWKDCCSIYDSYVDATHTQAFLQRNCLALHKEQLWAEEIYGTV